MTTSQTPTPDAPEFEARARALLTQYAEDMPATANTEARVRARLAAGTAGATRGPQTRWRPMRAASSLSGGWARGAISLGLVAALIIGFVGVVWLRDGLPWGGTRNQCSETRHVDLDGSSSLTHVCSLDNLKVHISVTQSYADATRTSLEVHITTPGAQIPHGQPIVYSQPDTILMDTTLTDQQGNAYTPPLGSVSNNLLTYGDTQDTATGVLIFSPLPEGALTTPQTLTLHISHITLRGDSGWLSPVKGEFTATFQVTPRAGRSITFNVAPQTHNGITMQPLRLDIAPDGNVFDGYGGGGARLFLRISGLPADANSLAVAGFSTQITLPDGNGSSSSGQSNLTLEGQQPAAIAGLPWDWMQPTQPVVGPSGTLVLEVIFFSPPLPDLSGTQRLTVNEISTAQGVVNPVTGPWSFLLPLG